MTLQLSQLMNQNWGGQLRECSLNGIAFPVEEVEMRISQRTHNHEYPNVPGADVESLSRHPSTWKVKALFINGLKRSNGGTWGNQLFPTAFQNVVRVLADDNNDTVPFYHPTLGRFNVKCMSGITRTVYSSRNGQIIEFELVESGFNDFHVNNNVFGNDLVAQGQQSAVQFDSNLATYSSNNPTLTTSITNVSATNTYATANNSVNTTTMNAAASDGIIDNSIYTMQNVSAQLDALNDPATASMEIYAELTIASMNALKLSQSSLNKITVTTPQTLNNLMITLLQYNSTITVEDIILLNPNIAGMPLIAEGTVVVYSPS